MNRQLEINNKRYFLLNELDKLSSSAILSGGEISKINKICDWMLNFLCKPYVNLGRKGDVCPYTRVSIEKDRLRVTIIRVQEEKIDEFINTFYQIFDDFKTSQIANKNIHNALVVILLNLKKTGPFIDKAHRILKPTIVKNGSMIGQFYPNCDIPGIHNPEYLALDSPHPLFVIRNMVENDIYFLKDKQEFKDHYFRFFMKRN